jgi:7,8-dihydroneopterin aldolase/epimerase/oxygenase
MDKIIVEDLEVSYRVGVPVEERQTPQRLLLRLELGADFEAAARGDELTRTIDYYQVTQRLLAFGAGREWKLIETLAVDIAEMVLKEFRPQTVTVRVKKFILPQTRYVAVEATRPLAKPAEGR